MSHNSSDLNPFGNVVAPHFFESKKNLLDRSWGTIQEKGRRFLKGLQRVASSLCLFGGLVGVMGILANVRPDGDLSFYLIPFLLLAQPIALLNPKQKVWQRIVGVGFVLLFWGFCAWSTYWYFYHHEWGYLFRWMFLSWILTFVMTWISWRRQEHTWHGVGEGLLLSTWLSGVALILILLGFLGYYMATQHQPDSTTSNILTVTAFLLFLVLIVMRFFWIDGIRRRRANRVHEGNPNDIALLIEWFMPRSYAFMIIAFLLLISEATMFYTIHRTSQTNSHHTIKPDLRGRAAVTSKLKTLNTPVSLHSQNKPLHNKRQSTSGHPTWWQWLRFTVTPRRFPHLQEKELERFGWFSYLGLGLLSLILTVLVTQQIRLWLMFQRLYARILYCVRMQARGESHAWLEPLKQEALADIRSLLNVSNFLWRWLILYACRAPAQSMSRHAIFDFHRYWQELRKSRQNWFSTHWDAPLFFAGMLLFLVSSLLAWLYEFSWTHWLSCFVPTLTAALFIFLARSLLRLNPPRFYQAWIWWLLLLHVAISFLTFFLASNVGIISDFWATTLWYAKFGTVIVFPILYIGSGKRYKVRIARTMDTSLDSDLQARRIILQSLWKLEHRQWLLSHLTYLIHPIRSGHTKLRSFFPSLWHYILLSLKALLHRLHEGLKKPAHLWRGALFRLLIGVIVMLWHLFHLHQLFPKSIFQTYGITLVCLVTPGLGSWLTWKLWVTIPRNKISGSSSLLDMHAYQWERLSSVTHRTLKSMMVCLSFAAMLLWVWWMQFSLVEMMGWGLLALVLIYPGTGPWLNARFLSGLLKRLEHQSQRQKEKEEKFLKNIYKDASRWFHIDRDIRCVIIQGSAAVVEEAYESLRQGRWDQEEQHALQRVYRQWLQNRNAQTITAQAVAQEMARELASLAEQSLDTLSSLLYDLNAPDHPERREYLRQLLTQPHALLPRNREVMEAIEKILALPLPAASMLPPDYVTSSLTGGLSRVLEELAHLLVYLCQIWSESFGIAPTDLDERQQKREDCSQALRLLAMLERSMPHQSPSLKTNTMDTKATSIHSMYRLFLQWQRYKHTAPSDNPWQTAQQELEVALWDAVGYAPSLRGELAREWKQHDLVHSLKEPGHSQKRDCLLRGLLRLILPTPLAFLHESMLQAQQQYRHIQHKRQKSAEPPRYQALKQLRQHIRPPDLVEQEKTLHNEQEVLTAQRHYQNAMYRMVEGVAMYLSGSLIEQDLLPKEYEPTGHLNMSVYQQCSRMIAQHQLMLGQDSMQGAEHTLAFLENWVKFTKIWLAANMVTTNIKEMEEHWHTNLGPMLLQYQEEWPSLHWHYKEPLPNPKPDDRPILHHIILEGYVPALSPNSIHETEHTDAPVTPQHSSRQGSIFLGDGVWSDVARPPQLEFSNALWCLKLLRELVYSAELLEDENESATWSEKPNDTDTKATSAFTRGRQERLDHLSRVKQHFLECLGSYTPEEQRILERQFEEIHRRWRLVTQGDDGMSGEDIIDFDNTIARLERYLHKRQNDAAQALFNLCWLNILPSHEFFTLQHKQSFEQHELRWYTSLTTGHTILRSLRR